MWYPHPHSIHSHTQTEILIFWGWNSITWTRFDWTRLKNHLPFHSTMLQLKFLVLKAIRKKERKSVRLAWIAKRICFGWLQGIFSPFALVQIYFKEKNLCFFVDSWTHTCRWAYHTTNDIIKRPVKVKKTNWFTWWL